MKLDMLKILKYKDEGWINIQKHPFLDIFITKYSRKTVFDNHWDDITLMCRGLWYDSNGNILARPFNKFFNHSEKCGIEEYETHKRNNLKYTVSEKLDGSLIIVSKINGKIIISSSGSFTSPQAIKSAELFKQLNYENFIEDGKTYLFEYIAPTNRIVVNYSDIISLSLIGIRDTDTGHEFPLDTRFDCVKTVDRSLEEIESELSQKKFINSEGYVVRFEDGSRVKLKYAAYMLLHKLVSGINEKWIWESLRDGVDFEQVLEDIPDELDDFVKKTKAALLSEYAKVEKEALNILGHVKESFPTRKDQAGELIKNFKPYSSIVFSMLDGRDYSAIIWKMLEPKSNTISRFGMGECSE